MMRSTMLALAFAVAMPGMALAQRYDSGWSRVAVADLEQLDVDGGGIRVNNFLVHPEQRAGRRETPEQALRTFVFTASTIRQDNAAREVFIQLVGVRENGVPTLSVATRTAFGASGGRQARQTQSKTPATEAEMAETRNYFVRIIVQ
jgi:hypothetical protein